jgi:predicted amidohydrolase YtcJ
MRDGVFVAMGDDGEVAPLIGPGTRIVDALGRRVIPGLNDSHLHAIRGGSNYLLELRWDGVPSLTLALRMLREQAERTPAGQWVRVAGGWTAEQFAEQRAAAWAPPVTKLLAAGLTVAAGTDATTVSSYNPWPALAWLTSGRNIGGYRLYPPANTVNRETALRMYTQAGAELTGEADRKGTITVGKYADLSILTADFFTVPDEQIPHIEAELTVAGGRVVYASDNYQGQSEPLPDITLDWSPVAHYGGYQNHPAGARQAQCLAEAAADSAEQRAWRVARGEHIHHHEPADGCW